jgi:hypothetical protein
MKGEKREKDINLREREREREKKFESQKRYKKMIDCDF